MKKVLIGILLLLFCIAQVTAQVTVQTESQLHASLQIGQYTFFPAAFNPAAVGKTGMIQVVGMNRMDFLTMPSGVNTTNVGVNMPFSIGSSSHGAGIRFVNRMSGTLWSHQNAYLQYAYKRNTPIGRFSVGVDIGFTNSRFDGTAAIFNPPPPIGGENEFHYDEPRFEQDMSDMALDFNVGVIYSFERGYVGLSMAHVTEPSLSLDEHTTATVMRVMRVMGSYNFRIPDTKITVMPHTLFTTNFIVHEWNLGAIFEFDEKFWGGLSVRTGVTAGGMAGFNAVGFNVGMNITGGISAGLLYDLPTTRLINTVGSVELFIAYNFEFVRNRHNRRHKSIRIL